MRNYRIVENVKKEKYHVQYEGRILGIKKWFYVPSGGSMLPLGDYWKSNELKLLMVFALLLSLVGTIIFLVDYELWNRHGWRSIDDCNDYIEKEKQKEIDRQEKAREIQKKGEKRVVGVWMGDEYIDGARLERMKKLERITEDE